jgi:Ca2+/H+ antiporter
MSHVFGQHFSYDRFGLAAIGLGMGFHLVAGALNQAALARGQARAAAACWLLAAAALVAWMFTHAVHGQLLRAEVGYAGATALLALALALLFRRGSSRRLPAA